MSKRGKKNGVRIDRDVFASKALQSLSRRGLYVLLQFTVRRRFGEIPNSGRTQWAMLNQGEITFSYREAKEKFGIGSSSFCRAIDELVRVGFIDIAKPGSGMCRSQTLYTVNIGPGANERWKEYGKSGFEVVERKKDMRHMGGKRPGFQRKGK